MKKAITRRDVIRVGSVIFASGSMAALEALMTGCGSASMTGGTSSTATTTSTTSTGASTSCVQSTNVTRGPYFVDEKTDPNISGDVVDSSIPQRSDIRADTKSFGTTQSGLPLVLTLTVGSYSSGGTCSPIQNAQVDIWHCNAQGVYSDVQGNSQNFLRGYQLTDANGQVAFTTVYPGWYSGRAVHIHIKVRVFDSSGNVTTEATTQLFFDDTISTAVFAVNSAYSRNSARDTLDANDSIYLSESPALLVNLTGSATAGYTGAVSIGVAVGTKFGG